MPKVSIITPAYNASKTLVETVRSALSQTFDDFEMIIVDDCSKDDTYKIASDLSEKDPRIKVFKNEKNLGVSKTRNFALSKAIGEYVAFLDSDDLWREDKLERQYALACETDADIIYCSYGIISENGTRKCKDFIVEKQTDFNKMLLKSVVSCSTAFIKRHHFDKYSFSSEYAHEDYVLWMSMFKDGLTAVGDQKVLAEYRVYPGTRSFDKFKAAKNRYIIYRKALKLSPCKSIKCIFKYMLLGLKKYKQI